MRRARPTSPPDFAFIGALIVLVVLGFVILASASSDLAKERFGDGFHYLKSQVVNGLVFGFLGFLFGASLYYHHLAKLSFIFLLISILFLLLVFTPLRADITGSARWLNIGGFIFQPSELLKITFILYIATWISRNEKRGRSFLEGFVPFVVLAGVTGFLLVKQPSTTIAVIIFGAAIITYFIGGARKGFLGLACLIGIALLLLLIVFTPYRLKRIVTFLNPGQTDILSEGYHRDQALTAIGSGGLIGVGYGKSTTKLRYLPEPIGDSIFAVAAEEFGFLGASALLSLFAFLLFRAFAIARQAPDTLGRILVTGFASLIGLQTFINIGAISGILPLTGVPLPFVSYGGTALTVFLTIGGIIVNVSRYRR